MEPEQFSPLPVPAEWLSTFDAYLIGEGTHERAYEKMGAHLVHLHGQDGVAFAVLLANITVPLIDYYTRPRVYGHRKG